MGIVREINRDTMKKAITLVGQTLAILAALDITILLFALLQVGIEGRTGYWSPFWMEQARFIIGLLN